MHDDRRLTEVRLDRFVRDRLLPAIYGRTVPLTVTGWTVPDEPVSFSEATAQSYLPVPAGAAWGAPWSTTWLRLTGAVPEGWGATAGTAVEVLVDLGFNAEGPGFQCEGIAWRPDGTIIKSVSPRSQHLPLELLGSAAQDGLVEVYIEAAANPDVAAGFTFQPNPLGDKATAGNEPRYRLGPIVLAELDRSVWELNQDVRALAGLMHELPMDQPRRYDILRALEKMMDLMDPEDMAGTAAAGREALAGVLSRPAYASAHSLVATGHAHIDSAWLWPVRETIRKCARTFSNVLALMDEHPDFVFSCASAQQLAWMKEYYPELFTRIRQKVAAGQFVPVGGMWVESDTNMPGGEAMARQFLEGKSFFRQEFGVDCRETWLPDSFGFSAALPQIAAAAGMRWFFTQKTSWNQVNKMPHHTFLWEGIDGTRIFTHFPPVDTYNSDFLASELAHAERNYREHGRGSVSLLPFGYGDGGGGPTREMIAAAHRTADLEGSPTVSIGTVESFFARASAEYANPPVWWGELYLELHRGTYTSQANTKAGNRRSEHLLREAELWAATATVRLGIPYPAAQLKRLWQLVLLQQFHDILPGSAIAWVHQDAERNYEAIAAELQPLISSSVAALAGDGDLQLMVNAAPHERSGVPPLAIAVEAHPNETVTVDELDGGYVLDNGIIRAVIDAQGLLTSLLDYATGRDAIAPGSFGNHLELHRDTPNAWDAWDIAEFYRHNVTSVAQAQSVTLDDDDAGEPAVVVERLVGRSPLSQRIALAAGSASLTIRTLIDWKESEKLLKLGFPLDVRADRSAAETQFGHVLRPTHTNTSWEAAKFEICAHRWIQVAEPGYGVAISNSATYGHDVTRTVRPDGGTTTTVRLSLLRAPKSPDPFTDQGPHGFVVTVRPGAAIADAVEEGYRTNIEPLRIRGRAPVEPLITVSNAALVIEAVKLAEDGSGDVVVRVYESLGERSTGLIAANFSLQGVSVTDLLEDDVPAPPEVRAGTDSAELSLRPFQLVTLRFRR